ncbi:MAG: hypothetical protein ACLPX7_11935 [Xanthobacteraceae bacterium]
MPKPILIGSSALAGAAAASSDKAVTAKHARWASLGNGDFTDIAFPYLFEQHDGANEPRPDKHMFKLALFKAFKI